MCICRHTLCINDPVDDEGLKQLTAVHYRVFGGNVLDPGYFEVLTECRGRKLHRPKVFILVHDARSLTGKVYAGL